MPIIGELISKINTHPTKQDNYNHNLTLNCVIIASNCRTKWEKGTNTTEKWGTHLNRSLVGQGDGHRGYLGRWACKAVGVYWSLVEEGSSQSRPIAGNGVARAGVWSLHRNLVAQGESPQLLREIGLWGLACTGGQGDMVA
ncbi:hypothetical protein CRG98_033285 [Punica granatum]|uniref:Uncharacterized protein n=1 Tax=Punica granatum TaxID=22663 RepID=A0A2I0IQP0_PUNGR|nr:hypothetical protein CRG98_033285 [Punica granatum]